MEGEYKLLLSQHASAQILLLFFSWVSLSTHILLYKVMTQKLQSIPKFPLQIHISNYISNTSQKHLKSKLSKIEFPYPIICQCSVFSRGNLSYSQKLRSYPQFPLIFPFSYQVLLMLYLQHFLMKLYPLSEGVHFSKSLKAQHSSIIRITLYSPYHTFAQDSKTQIHLKYFVKFDNSMFIGYGKKGILIHY